MERANEFVEVQWFRQSWIWIVLLANFILVITLFGYGMFLQLVLGEPWGNRPMSDTGLLAVGIGAIAFSVGLVVLFRIARLKIRVAPDVLSISFRPFTTRRIPYNQIVRVEPRKYRPLVEYGGYGIRWGPRGTAYNISGNQGVQLELANGRKILLGSQNPEGLAEAIKGRIASSRN